jgi:competence CoiA-like predicted nuclease
VKWRCVLCRSSLNEVNIFPEMIEEGPLAQLSKNDTGSSKGLSSQAELLQKVIACLLGIKKEIEMYKIEAEQQKGRVQKLVQDGAIINDIRKQNEVLEETLMMIPDSEARYLKAKEALKRYMEEYGLDLKSHSCYQEAFILTSN